jgi:general secretion pathway protein A
MSNAKPEPASLELVSNPESGSGTPATVEASISAFGETRDTRFFFPGEQAGEVVEALVGLVSEGDMGIGVVVGDPGCGKTLLRSELHRRLVEQNGLCVTLENGWLDFDAVLLEILSQLEGRRVRSVEFPQRYDRLAAVKQALVERVVQPGRHLALLIDEAQQLDDATLDGVRSLTNINAERRNFLTPVLFGHATLEDRIGQTPSLASRVRIARRLQPLSETGTCDYVSHRIRMATGQAASPFTAGALSALHGETGGVPRIINQRCKTALRAALERGLGAVDERLFGERRKNTATCRSWPDSCLIAGQ